MRLPEPDAHRFITLYVQTIGRCAGALDPDGSIDDGRSYMLAEIEEKAAARDLVFDHPEIIADYVADNPDELDAEDLARVDAWQTFVRGNMVIERDLKRHTIFLQWEDDPVAYGVFSLLDEVVDLLPAPPPMLVEAVLLPWDGRIVCDGMISYKPVHLGPGIRASLKDAYREAKAKGIVTSLAPATETATSGERPANQQGRGPTTRIEAAHLDAVPGLRRTAARALIDQQPATVGEAMAIPHVGRKAASRLLELGLLTDPDGTLADAPRHRAPLAIVEEPPTASPTKTLHLLTVTLRHIEPAIWRRLLVPSDIALSRLHEIVQAAMGWHDCHLHDFEIGDEHYGVSHGDAALPWDVHDETRHRLGDLVQEGDVVTYTYDFGDDWHHDIVVKRVIGKPNGLEIGHGLCLDGARAGPPEDSGGLPGYERLVAALANRRDPEHKRLREWVGDWDAEVFDVDVVNRRLG